MSNPLKGTVSSREMYEQYKKRGMKPAALARVKELLKELDTFPIMGSIGYKGPTKKGQAIADKIGRIVMDQSNFR